MASKSFKGQLSFFAASKMLGDKNRKMIGGNTTLEREGEGFIVKLHGNMIMKISALNEGKITVYDGGYSNEHGCLSVTTKRRLNDYMPSGYSLYTDQKRDWLKTPNGAVRFEHFAVIQTH
jgi:hypothetical protein